MSCKATRPFISREDAAFIRPDPLSQSLNLSYQEIVDLGQDPFKRANVTPQRALEISKLIPRVIKLDPLFLETVPSLQARISGAGFVNPFEVADMMDVAGFNSDEVYNELVNSTTGISTDLKSFFQQLDFYYDEYLSISYKPGRCEELYNIWQLIVQVELIVKTAMNWIARIKDFTLQDLIDKLLDIERLIKEFMEKLVERILARIEQLALEFLAKIGIFVDSIDQVVQWINQKITDLKTYLSEANIKKIAEDIGNEIKKMFTPLEDFSPSNIAYMLWRLCRLIESIKDFFKNPLNLFKEGLIALTSAQILLSSMSEQKREAAARLGHTRVSSQTRAEIQDQIIRDVNGANPAANGAGARVFGATELRAAALGSDGLDAGGVLDVEGNELDVGSNPTTPIQLPNNITFTPAPEFIPPRTSTPEEIAWYAQARRPDYNGVFSYSPGVRNMHAKTVELYENARRDPTGTQTFQRTFSNAEYIRHYDANEPPYENSGFDRLLTSRDNRGVSPALKLRRTILAMRDTFYKPFSPVINSGYRHPAYNYAIGGAGKSMHKSGQAIDVSIGHYSWIEQIYFAYYATQFGLYGIGLYGGFMHVDARTAKMVWRKQEGRNRVTPEQEEKVWPQISHWYNTGQWLLPELAAI